MHRQSDQQQDSHLISSRPFYRPAQPDRSLKADAPIEGEQRSAPACLERCTPFGEAFFLTPANRWLAYRERMDRHRSGQAKEPCSSVLQSPQCPTRAHDAEKVKTGPTTCTVIFLANRNRGSSHLHTRLFSFRTLQMTKPPCGGLSLQEHHDEQSMKNQGVSGKVMVGRDAGRVKSPHQTCEQFSVTPAS